ncbi:hypothetical protein SESBI_30633 [Sesbania bispinosa]|nr:hypothetical protein SESBI_30633 [Sesbania bispinosa]
MSKVVFWFSPGRGWTESEGIISSRTSKSTGSIIISVAIRGRASCFEHFRVHRRPTCRRRAIRAAAAVFRATKGFTRALARASVPCFQLRRALQAEIRSAPGRSAETRPATSFHDNRQIVPIHEAYIVKVLAHCAKRELR